MELETGNHTVSDQNVCEISVEFGTELLDFIYSVDMHTHTCTKVSHPNVSVLYTSNAKLQNLLLCRCCAACSCLWLLLFFCHHHCRPKFNIIAKTATDLVCLVHVLGNFNLKHMYIFTYSHLFGSFVCLCARQLWLRFNLIAFANFIWYF